jgi:protein TonB
VKGGVAGGTAGGDAIVGPSYGADYLRNAPPKYPAIARRMNLEGTTTLRVLVSVEGHPKSVRVQMSSGVDVLDEAALEAVQHWSFVPARRGSTPVAAEVNVPVRFRLDGTTAE